MTTTLVMTALYALGEADREIALAESTQSRLSKELETLVQSVSKARLAVEQSAATVSASETRLKEKQEQVAVEQEKITSRRKQIADLGGMKAAKFAEREVDIASRALQTLTERAHTAENDLQRAQEMQLSRGVALEQAQTQLEAKQAELEAGISEALSSISSWKEKREVHFSALDDSARRLYQRIQSKYPAEPIAVADRSCQVCHRSLPIQLLNQMLASPQLHQCPGCGRILVLPKTPAA